MNKPDVSPEVFYYLDQKMKKVRVAMVKDHIHDLPENGLVMVRQINNGKYYYVKAKKLKREKA